MRSGEEWAKGKKKGENEGNWEKRRRRAFRKVGREKSVGWTQIEFGVG